MDSNCIYCETCIGIAPDNFTGTGEHSYVKAQPQTEIEEDLCREALENCPVGAIGDDGA
ncbi:MAG: ferredoxin [Pseudomonadota bacterium]